MPLKPEQHFPVMCITQDNLPLTHVEQAEQLCEAGARWIQLRMKNAAPQTWIDTARAVVAVSRAHEAVCIINDSVEVALASEADGVHLGRLDLEWVEARRRLGPDRLLGGTVNDAIDVARVRAAGCLDYAGVGPLRFTTTKQILAPVLGQMGIRPLILGLIGLPVWVIGGIEPGDLRGVRAAGAAGVAVSSALFARGQLEGNFRAFLGAWNRSPSVEPFVISG